MVYKMKIKSFCLIKWNLYCPTGWVQSAHPTSHTIQIPFHQTLQKLLILIL